MKFRYVIALVVLFLASCNQARERVPLTSVGVFEVSGDQPFLRTGYDLLPGYYYTFSHRGGNVCLQSGSRCGPPRGSDVAQEEGWGLRLLIGEEIVQVRDQMVLSVEGKTPLVFYVPEGEELEFSEDKRPFYEDNTGHWEIEVLTFNETPEVQWTRGANITSYTENGYCSDEMESLYRRLLTLHANTVMFVVVFQTDGVDVFPAPHSPRTYCLAKATRSALRLGLKVGWNLHVDPPENGWRGALIPKDKEAFFAAYREFARFYAAMAQELGVEYLIPATEMSSLTEQDQDRQRWLSIFLELHSVFFGTISYAADRSEYARLDGDFWRACCDVIGITPWYTLTSSPYPTVDELTEAWGEVVVNMERFANAVRMRILLVEGPGYRAIEGCATEPAEYLEQAKVSDLCQTEGYRAFLRTFGADRKQVIAGHLLWEIRVPGETLSDYSPLDRMTESILKEGWKGGRP